MSNRTQRIEFIVNMIKDRCITGQEQLRTILEENGFQVTQATLSRDLKLLKVTKVANDRGYYRYVLPDSELIKNRLLADTSEAMSLNNQDGFVSLALSGNIAVLRTRIGFAARLAYEIDKSNDPDILGTIAGTDTIFVVLKEKAEIESVMRIFSHILPGESMLR